MDELRFTRRPIFVIETRQPGVRQGQGPLTTLSGTSSISPSQRRLADRLLDLKNIVASGSAFSGARLSREWRQIVLTEIL